MFLKTAKRIKRFMVPQRNLQWRSASVNARNGVPRMKYSLLGKCKRKDQFTQSRLAAGHSQPPIFRPGRLRRVGPQRVRPAVPSDAVVKLLNVASQENSMAATKERQAPLPNCSKLLSFAAPCENCKRAGKLGPR